MERTLAVLAEAVSGLGIPSVSANVRLGGREVFHQTLGLARRSPPRPALEDQAYDLASVTKALAGASVAASLVEEGLLDLHAPVAEVLPDVDPRVTAAHLLTHSSGYPAWAPLYAEVEGAWGTEVARQTILDAARATPLEGVPGEHYRYSDLGFLVLLELLEALTGRRLEALFQDRVLGPAGQAELRWGWPTAAATEACPVRGVLVEGTVHDLNAAALGGVSTHAGLFGTARSVAHLGDRLLAATRGDLRGSGLPGRGLRDLWNLRGAGCHRGGWDSPSVGSYTSTGRHFTSSAIGHLGYTGTSLWILPEREAVIVLLTNRVHPDDPKEAIRALRPRFHDAVVEDLGWA